MVLVLYKNQNYLFLLQFENLNDVVLLMEVDLIHHIVVVVVVVVEDQKQQIKDEYDLMVMFLLLLLQKIQQH
jgi:hypothetical protein